MHARTAFPTFLGAAALIAATGALAAPAKDKPVVMASYYTMADRAIDPMSASIRAILVNAGDQGDFIEKQNAGALTAFYQKQGYVPSWIADGKLSERALAVIARIKQADTDGLDPAAYALPHVQIGLAMPATLEAQARAEVMLSQAVMDYVRDAHSGRLDPADVSQNFDYKPHVADPVTALSKVSMAEDAPAVLAGYNPQRPEFVALRKKLAEARESSKDLPPVVPSGPNLKLGMTDPRVIILRERLHIEPPSPEATATPTVEAAPPADEAMPAATSAVASAEDAVTVTQVAATGADMAPAITEPAPEPVPFNPELYDETVDAAVRAFQESAGLKADGIAGPATLSRLNAAADDHIDTIIVNMERWRWMPEQLGDYYVRVNIPNFNLDIYKNGKVFYTTRIVVGKPQNQTPIFSDEIEHVIVNPTWNVPASIATKEMLPQLRANPAALSGYQVFANIGGRFRVVNPYSIDWRTVDMRKIQIKQPPGERNALGSVKFMFPNPYAVYLHDTPSKSLFQRDYRAYSHGCMRVMDPWSFADALLTHDPKVDASAIKKYLGGAERQVNLTRHIPVHITYFTAWVDEDGKLQVRDDVYGHDRRTEKALGLTS